MMRRYAVLLAISLVAMGARASRSDAGTSSINMWLYVGAACPDPTNPYCIRVPTNGTTITPVVSLPGLGVVKTVWYTVAQHSIELQYFEQIDPHPAPGGGPGAVRINLTGRTNAPATAKLRITLTASDQ